MARLNYSRIGDRLLAGAMPFRADHVAALRAEGVTAVVNLCQEREYWDGERDLIAAAYAEHGIAEHHLPVIDGSTVPAGVLDAAVALAGDHTVYVHCRGGRERSAAVAVAILANRSGTTIDEALEAASACWPTCRPLPWQLAGVRAWAASRE
jgi:protein tyrosine phosphatase (PTP) superfamily phosphohydrolase (DUF442 family)